MYFGALGRAAYVFHAALHHEADVRMKLADQRFHSFSEPRAVCAIMLT